MRISFRYFLILFPLFFQFLLFIVLSCVSFSIVRTNKKFSEFDWKLFGNVFKRLILLFNDRYFEIRIPRIHLPLLSVLKKKVNNHEHSETEMISVNV